MSGSLMPRLPCHRRFDSGKPRLELIGDCEEVALSALALLQEAVDAADTLERLRETPHACEAPTRAPTSRNESHLVWFAPPVSPKDQGGTEEATREKVCPLACTNSPPPYTPLHSPTISTAGPKPQGNLPLAQRRPT